MPTPYLQLELLDLSGSLVHGSITANGSEGLGHLPNLNLAHGVYLLRLGDSQG